MPRCLLVLKSFHSTLVNLSWLLTYLILSVSKKLFKHEYYAFSISQNKNKLNISLIKFIVKFGLLLISVGRLVFERLLRKSAVIVPGTQLLKMLPGKDWCYVMATSDDTCTCIYIQHLIFFTCWCFNFVVLLVVSIAIYIGLREASSLLHFLSILFFR